MELEPPSPMLLCYSLMATLVKPSRGCPAHCPSCPASTTLVWWTTFLMWMALWAPPVIWVFKACPPILKVLSFFYRKGTSGPERVSNFTKVTQLVCSSISLSLCVSQQTPTALWSLPHFSSFLCPRTGSFSVLSEAWVMMQKKALLACKMRFCSWPVSVATHAAPSACHCTVWMALHWGLHS